MSEESSVLRFEGVEYRSPSEMYASFAGAGFTLCAGGLTGVRIDRDSEHVPLADLATGLLVPMAGRVLFGGCDWTEMSVFEQAAARGRIGCVLEENSWISSLTVRQNILLRERHHTRRAEDELVEEAERLCKAAGLDGIPEGRPEGVRPRERRMLEWVRAFMGTPALAVLVFPDRDAFSGAGDVCGALVEQARAAGTAVLWISDRTEVWSQPFMAGAEHYEIRDERWIPRRREEF